jgi:hypothetical protein
MVDQRVDNKDIVQTWIMMCQAILRSRTAHTHFGALSYDKRSTWLRNLAYDMESDDMKAAPEAFRSALRLELTQQPYSGHYLFFLLFEDNSDDHLLMSKALNNTTDYDFVAYLASQDIAKSTEYYDVNR